MTIQFKTDAVYTLGANGYTPLRLICTYIEDNTIWFKAETYPASFSQDLYKLNRKTNKLYKLNQVFSSYDLVENTLSEYNAEEFLASQRKSRDDVTRAYDYLE